MFPSQGKEDGAGEVSPGEGMRTEPPSFLPGPPRPGLWVQIEGASDGGPRCWKPWPGAALGMQSCP